MASSIGFVQTILIVYLLASTKPTVANRHLLQKTVRLPSLPSITPGTPPSFSAMSPKVGKLPSLSQGSLPPLSTIISAMSPTGSNLPSLSQGSLPPLSSIISAMSPKTSNLPPFSQGSLTRLSGLPPLPSTRKAAPSPRAATSLPSRPSTIPKVPRGRFSLPVLSPPPARTRT